VDPAIHVFLSYAHEDRDRAQQIAELLAAEKLEVWWDRKILTGRDYQTAIQESIQAARCVLVLWSTVSVRSEFVRAEASEGHDRKVLLPVMLEPVRLPLAFRLLQTEDFTGWDGDKEAECWKRLTLQIRAMAALPVPDPSVSIDPALNSRGFRRLATSQRGGTSVSYGAMLTLLAVSALIGARLLAPGNLSGILAATIGIAAVVFLLFRMAESDVSPRMRALATQWLLPRPREAFISSAEAMNHLFNAVFGERHLSSYCFVRAALASVVFLAIVIVLIRYILGATVVFTAATWASLILYASSVNVVGDYSALYLTRVMLELYRRGYNIGLLVVVDFAATVLVFVTTVAAAIAIINGISAINGNATVLRGATFSQSVVRDVTRVVHQPYLDIYEPTSPDLLPVGQRRLLYASAATTFVTSIWLWAALALAPAFRVIVWAGGTGLTAVGFIFDVHRTPFAALGYFGALIVLVTGGTIWGTGVVFALLVT
jgi:hypothetical protein